MVLNLATQSGAPLQSTFQICSVHRALWSEGTICDNGCSVASDAKGATVKSEEVKDVVAKLEADWTAEDYHVFDKNCVHFSVDLAARVCEREAALLAPPRAAHRRSRRNRPSSEAANSMQV